MKKKEFYGLAKSADEAGAIHYNTLLHGCNAAAADVIWRELSIRGSLRHDCLFLVCSNPWLSFESSISLEDHREQLVAAFATACIVRTKVNSQPNSLVASSGANRRGFNGMLLSVHGAESVSPSVTKVLTVIGGLQIYTPTRRTILSNLTSNSNHLSITTSVTTFRSILRF